MDPYTFLILDLFTIGWCILGVHMMMELWPEAPTLGWRITIFPFMGPLAWALLAYRGLGHVRRHILARFGVPASCGCCSHH